MPTPFGLASALLIAFACAPCASFAQEPSGISSETYINPVPIERRAPNYPGAALSQSREGWVIVSYIVAPDGTVAEPMIENSSGGEAFERAALRAVSQWRYQPAMLDGNAVEQSMTKVRIVFRLENTANGATSPFRRRHQEAAELIADGEPAAALPIMDELEFGQRANLYEDAWFWWLKYMYLEATQSTDTEQKIAALQLALGHEEDYLESNVFVAAAQMLYVMHVRGGDYSAARSTFARLRDSRTARRSDRYDEVIANLTPSFEQINELIAGDQTLVTKAEIGRYDYWVHDLLRRSFSLADVRGRVDVVDIRCERGTKRYDEFPADSVWAVPESWGPCGVYVKGEPGTTFDFEEYSSSAAATEVAR